jgi:RNA polymerase sigma-70 factor (ECF subfamily)
MAPRDPLADPKPLIGRVYAFVAFNMGPGAEAEDVTSQVFERAVRYRDSYDPQKGSAVTWLLGIARRCIADAHLRDPVHVDELDNQTDGRDLEEETVRRFELSDALGRLDERERDLLALRYGAGLSSREIGRFVGLERGAVDVALHRARTRLRKDLAGGVEGESRDAPRPRDASSKRL